MVEFLVIRTSITDPSVSVCGLCHSGSLLFCASSSNCSSSSSLSGDFISKRVVRKDHCASCCYFRIVHLCEGKIQTKPTQFHQSSPQKARIVIHVNDLVTGSMYRWKNKLYVIFRGVNSEKSSSHIFFGIVSGFLPTPSPALLTRLFPDFFAAIHTTTLFHVCSSFSCMSTESFPRLRKNGLLDTSWNHTQPTQDPAGISEIFNL